jgi:hypothetical protein
MTMQHLRSIWCLLFIAFTVSAVSAPAHALNFVSWVSAGGNNGNPCTRAAPCATFFNAIVNTAINGEVRCLDAGSDFGGATIHQSITIDCHDVPAVVVAACFDIQLTTSGASDPAQTVKIRGVTCDAQGVSGFGIRIGSASAVFLEDMVIVGYQSQGVLDARTHGGVLFIKNSLIRNSGGPGIVAAATGGPYGASIDNVHSNRNGFGIAVGTGNNVRINHSEFSNNAVGIEVDPGGQVGIDSSVLSFNGTGLQNNGTMSFSNSDITFNTTAISGATFSFGNNRIFGNSAPGTAPSPASFK